jgi:hypothetical protein
MNDNIENLQRFLQLREQILTTIQNQFIDRLGSPQSDQQDIDDASLILAALRLSYVELLNAYLESKNGRMPKWLCERECFENSKTVAFLSESILDEEDEHFVNLKKVCRTWLETVKPLSD